MCCGHQHQNICCRKTDEGIIQKKIDFEPVAAEKEENMYSIEVARIPLDVPTLFRVGGCHGDYPEFAYTDFTSFSFIRLNLRD
jgi:hypothetical protein